STWGGTKPWQVHSGFQWLMTEIGSRPLWSEMRHRTEREKNVGYG
ncbi:MAG: hypothetical protein ACI80I_002889, partial [Akkermansiaceae bacterium]